MAARDIIVVGASAGGFEAIQVLLAGLPADLNAAVFVTLHLYPRSLGILPRLIRTISPLPAAQAEDGMPIRMGHIYVAPPDFHLVVQNGFIQLSHGPKENLQRPCINVMFRSAAAAYGERVAGVLLTGLLDDGAAGLWEIQQRNGATIVQDPEEATFRSMPDSAIRGLNVQYIVRLHEMPSLLTRLSLSDQSPKSPGLSQAETEPAGQVCPECGGVMTATHMNKLLDYRCHTGHRFGLSSLISQKSLVVEQALNTALSQSEELSKLLRTAMTQNGPGTAAALQEEINRRAGEQETLRELAENSRDPSQIY